MKNNLYKYKYYDTIEKKIKDCEIFSPFSLFKCNGFTKIEYIFVHDSGDGSKVANVMFRDRNSIFVKDKRTNKWYGTNADVFLEATNYATTEKENFSATEFIGDYYVVRKKGNGYVAGSEDEYKKLPRHQKHLMLIYIRTKTIIVLLRDIDFFVLNTYIIRSRFSKSVLALC